MNELRFASLYADGMVIQRGKSFPLRGRCAKRGTVAAVFRGKTYVAQADETGAWRMTLDATEAGGPFTLEICSGGETAVVREVSVGDVWFCGGQSYMEMQLPRVRDRFPEEWEAHDYPPVCEFRIPQEWDFHAPRDALDGGMWRRLSRETIDTFSAATYFFAKKYAAEHRVAVGLVNASWGGSPAEAWMSAEDVAKTFPYKRERARRYARDDLREKALADAQSGVADWEQALCEADTGLKEHWEKGADDVSGQEISIPAAFAETDALQNFCGSVWMTRTFTAGEELAGKPLNLWLGTITDSDRTYVNGIFVGGTTYRYPPRKYTVPPGVVRKGENVIVVRVVCCNREGAFIPDKPYALFPVNAGNREKSARIDLAGTWRYKIGARCGLRPEELFLNREASGLYNAMIYPAREFPVKGILYYQAESNDEKPHEYETLFKALISGWRAIRGGQTLPFVFVQLPIWGEPSDNDDTNDGKTNAWAVLRNAQKKALSLPQTAMAVGLDAGEWNDLHPVDKKTIGERLFLAVEKLVFGADNSSPGPLPASYHIKDGVLTITFAHCADGLAAKTPVLLTLVADGGSYTQEAEITGRDTLTVKLGSLSPDRAPKRVLYAWANTPKHAGLFNGEGLPAAPFRLVMQANHD
jgi:sialate O-acetylesterase